MIGAPKRLIAEFVSSARDAGLGDWSGRLWHEAFPAPHRPPRAPKCPAVYVFSLSAEYGATCPAGPNRVLKVGRAGANSGPRFSYQHYAPSSAPSNLARRLVVERVLWTYLGIEHLDENTVKAWMLASLDRDHILLPLEAAGLERQVERYLCGRFGPVFER